MSVVKHSGRIVFTCDNQSCGGRAYMDDRSSGRPRGWSYISVGKHGETWGSDLCVACTALVTSNLTPATFDLKEKEAVGVQSKMVGVPK